MFCPVYDKTCIISVCQKGQCDTLYPGRNGPIIRNKNTKRKYLTENGGEVSTGGQTNHVHSSVSRWYSSKKACFYCAKDLRPDKATADHFYPKSKGGKIKVAACKPCNSFKSNRLPADFAAIMMKQPKRFPEECVIAVMELNALYMEQLRYQY